MEKQEHKKEETSQQDTQETNPNVQQGQAAIKAAQHANPEPKEKQEQKEKEDAEKWRNEG